MIFTSIKFLLFFAIVLFGYYIIPKKAQWVWLLAASVFFYVSSKPVFLVFLGASILITYLSALYMKKLDNEKNATLEKRQNSKTKSKGTGFEKKANRKRLAVCIVGTVLNVGILAYTKYVNFFLENISAATGSEFTAIDVIIPLGISFYTFQTTGYLIDVYRRNAEPEKNPLKYALYASFFPQILQGPIAKYNELAPQMFAHHRFNYEKVKSGLLRMLWGFFKKLVIADRVAIFVNMVYNNYEDYSGFVVAVAAIFYMVQLYTDFSGYMDIAIGAGEALDITMTENFKAPFFSSGVPEFWRRWHVSLGRWFKDYIYIPMGGNRKGTIRTLVNLAVVWIVTGVWHGASWNFVFWGVYFGALIIISRLLTPYIKKLEEKLRINTECFSFRFFAILKTFLLVCFGFIFFRADGFITSLRMIKSMITQFNPWVFFDGTFLELGLDGKNWNVVIISLIVLFCVSLANEKGIKVREKIAQQNLAFRWAIYLIGIFAVMIFGIYGAAYDAASFIYFDF